MPLTLSNRDQNSGHLFYHRRLVAAITRFSVRMRHDDRKQQAAVALSLVFVMIGVGWMTLLHWLKPAGLIGDAAVLGNRDTGQIYARLDGRLYPALNLTSARLAVAAPTDPTWVTAAEIARYPTGPLIGIPGAPDELTTTAPGVVTWSVCDTAHPQSAHPPTVTSIAGDLPAGDRSRVLGADEALLVGHGEDTYVLWAGHRARLDPGDRALTFTLGLDPDHVAAVALSTALFDAIPAAGALVVPTVPDAGAPSRWVPGATVGTVLATRDVTDAVTGLYVLLGDGVQPVSRFVADLLATAAGGSTPRMIDAGLLVRIPTVEVLDVADYPPSRLQFVDPDANPVTCLSWRRAPGDPAATVTVRSGRGLPAAADEDRRVVTLVRNDRAPGSVEADRTLLLPGAARFVATTSAAVGADTRESLYWLSPQGVRFGIGWDPVTLRALALDPADAAPAPWPLLRTFAAGPALSRADALVARDTVPASAATAVRTDDDGGER
ncbi:type VII secretion protein EccB [Mycobacterium koreense]|uniref:Type VII secretion protein EccB n=1 Tax=Mycolicibacillus koreensis TaxID=1069220 RepID=A0A7I7SGS4_9MYCO|nr:type VII secretion protein EccB [Mycolicibacillus koreensis]MCV7247097.1 type VII secretion protein EccB [Mycolicibacillus koreensis]OSC31880.1 type VII secretion protein EccB [Mycolicibacillus koreensis]BBY55953.1 ESX-2 secretion system ATPase EccB2 [Mycolicibacillus koreensis]